MVLLPYPYPHPHTPTHFGDTLELPTVSLLVKQGEI